MGGKQHVERAWKSRTSGSEGLKVDMTRDDAPLIVHTDWSSSWGGQEIRTLTELREMRRLGFRCCLLVPEGSELARRAREERLPVCPVEFTSKFHLPTWRKLAGVIRELRPAVVNTHSSEDSWMAGAVARLGRVPLIVRTRHILSPVSSTFSYNVFPHVILACSAAIRDGLIEQGVPAGKVIVQPTGIDEEKFRFSMDKRREIRDRYGIGENEILVGNVGFLRTYKGHIFIIKTAVEMPKGYTFMLVGGGQDLPLLKAEAERKGVGDRFIFTGHQERPENFFSAFDILFFSSKDTEGIAQSFIQGLLYGLPLLVCRTPSLLEPLSCVQNYRLIDYDDVASAREGLLQLSTVLQRDEQAVGTQRKALAKRYGLRPMIDNLLGVYARFGIIPPG
jgi:glycosyltransferase involved in cell wall biosynthesis